MVREEVTKLEEKVKKTIEKYHLIEQGDKIVVGVSGGPDSMCLLRILHRATLEFSRVSQIPQRNPELVGTSSPKKPGTSGEGFEIVVAHINHQLRKEADEEEQYVRKFCEKNGIEFFSKRIDVKNLAHTNKIGTEEAGRKVRYEFFEEVLKKTKANKIAVAHNKNDKIETIFLHMLRGSGIEGLQGIAPQRGHVIRPLIECEREEIEQYCKENNLEPKIDKSNFENVYHRNKVRNIVVPYIQKEFNPNIIQTMDRLSELVGAENQYMEKQTEKAYQEILLEETKQEVMVDLKSFNLLENVIKSRVIRYIIKRLFGTTASIEKIHIEDIIKLCGNNIGNKYLTPNKNLKVLVKNHRIYFKKS